jgi:hypothetical protein
MTMRVLDFRKFSKMSREELLGFCRDLYTQKGIAAFSYPALKTIPKLYVNLYANELSQKTLLKELGITEEYKQYLHSKPMKYGNSTRVRWSWKRVIESASAIKKSEGHLPPALWFQSNGHGSFVQAIYSLGRTWADLREAVGDFSGSNFVQSRNGIRWLSHAEASLSNFLYARGVQHKKGERYHQEYSECSAAKYAFYDLHFLVKSGQWIDVEVWGDRPNGHNEKRYAETRAAKELFNSKRSNFVGIHHADCYDDKKLSRILRASIGDITPFVFDNTTDAVIQSTHWSNTDELLDYCKSLLSKMPNGKFPAEDWLRKRGRWANRDGDAYNTLAVYIKLWFGGVRNLRELLGQSAISTKQWNRSSALAAYKEFYEKYGLTPHQLKHNFRRKKELSISKQEAFEATNLSAAVQKYVGGAAVANAELGIETSRQSKWSKLALQSAVSQCINDYGLSPNQVLYDNSKGRVDLSVEKVTMLKQITDAISRYPGKVDAIYSELGISAPTRVKNKRRFSALKCD